MSLLNPIALWALAGLAIPIGIHLLSRKEGKTIRLGSIRFLSETATSKFSSIKLNEVVLLIIRCALLIIIVLLLAGLLFSIKNSTETRYWVVVENGLEKDPRINTLLDSLSKNKYELKKLELGFPIIDEVSSTDSPDYYKLTEALAATENLQAIVIAKNRLVNFKGKRNALPVNITWLSYPTNETLSDTTTRKTISNDTLTITIAFDAPYQYDKKIMVAALQSLQGISPQPIRLHEVAADKFNSTLKSDWLIWLSDAKTDFQGKVLRYQPNSFNNLLHTENNVVLTLTSRLDEKTALENHLPIQLMNMLFSNTIDQAVLQQRDTRSVSDSLAWSQKNAGVIDLQKTNKQADKLLLILIVILFITERIFAFYRKQ